MESINFPSQMGNYIFLYWDRLFWKWYKSIFFRFGKIKVYTVKLSIITWTYTTFKINGPFILDVVFLSI